MPIEGAGEPDAFGYSEVEAQGVMGIQTAEGKDPETLRPIVIVFFRTKEHPDLQQAFAIPLTLAEAFEPELKRWMDRAHQKHWETDWGAQSE